MSHIKKILVPVNGSPSSLAALWEAVALAEDLEAAVEVLSVNAPEGFAVGSARAMAPSSRAEDDRAMDDAIGRAKGRLGDRLGCRAESGDPVRAILAAAASGRFDLVVIGTHGRVGRLHALLGSVAEGVVRNSPCPVLTVRESAGEQESFGERIHGRPSIAGPAPRSR